MAARIRNPGAAKRGGFLLSTLVLTMVLAGVVALSLARLSSQAYRSGHWFLAAQQAHDLADAALRTVLAEADDPGVDPADRDAVRLAAVRRLEEVASARDRSSGPVTLVSSRRPELTPAALRTVLRSLEPLGPEVDVTAQLLETGPLWNGSLSGLAADPAERSGRVRIVSRARVGPTLGPRPTRTIAIERRFKVVSLLPPLVGRFSLFVQRGPDVDPNGVRIRLDRLTGDGVIEPGPLPLVVQSDVRVCLVEPGTPHLTRSRMAADVPDPTFLDRQGWVFLGAGGGTPWRLRLAHGFSGTGETPLVPGRFVPVLAGNDEDEDRAFRRRFVEAFSRGHPEISLGFTAPGDGLHHLVHGFTSDYELVGLDRSIQRRVQDGTGRRSACELGPGDSSLLRLFGTAQALSPTLVFGPVSRLMVRKVAIQSTRTPAGGEGSGLSGTIAMPVLTPRDHDPEAVRALSEAFGSSEAFAAGASRVVEEPLVQGLNVCLDARGDGEYGPEGLLEPLPARAAQARFSSRLLPGLGQLPAPGGIGAQALRALWSGEVGIPGLFSGNLARGLGAATEAILRKVTQRVTGQDAMSRLVREGALRLGGVVLFDGPGTLRLPAVDRVDAGGILVSRGTVHLDGSLVRGAGGPPVTIVSLQGDIVLGPGARLVEAFLITPRGRVRFSRGEVTIAGGIAGRDLDLETLRAAPAPRLLRYVADFDPLRASGDGARGVCFVAGDRVVVGGEVP